MLIDFDRLDITPFTGDCFLIKESKIDKLWKQQRPQRAKIIIAGIRKNKSSRKIVQDLKDAGLLHSNHWVDRCVRYYKWKMALGEISSGERIYADRSR